MFYSRRMTGEPVIFYEVLWIVSFINLHSILMNEYELLIYQLLKWIEELARKLTD